MPWKPSRSLLDASTPKFRGFLEHPRQNSRAFTQPCSQIKPAVVSHGERLGGVTQSSYSAASLALDISHALDSYWKLVVCRCYTAPCLQFGPY